MVDTFIQTFHTETFHGLTIRFEAHVDEFYDAEFDDENVIELIRSGELLLFAVNGVISADCTDLSFDWISGVVARSFEDFLDGGYDDMRVTLIKGAQYKLGKLDAIYRALPVDRELFPVSRCG